MAVWNVRVIRPLTILVTVHGDVGVDDAREAAQKVAALLLQQTTPMDIWFDIREISSYAVKAREDWATLLKQHRDRVGGLAWITVRSTHRMVGRAVGLFTGIPTKILDDVPAELRSSG